ncbi:MAG: TIGR01777 family protein [Acidobacteria bacterium]|nr:TIGR01777 family protein [Acidobacteriota bacterium]
MIVGVTGSTGLVGSALVASLRLSGGEVRRLVRSESPGEPGSIRWNPRTGETDMAALEGLDAVVHLAGENIAGGRWTPARKRRIKDSRVLGTRHLVQALGRLANPPACLVSASAIGYYGGRGGEKLTEESGPGSGFLAEVCREWEAAAQPAADRGIRLVILRIGIVLSKSGGALATMLTPFRLGLGGRLGSGGQYMSWITLDDLVGAILHALHDGTLAGPVNAVAPSPVTNREFTGTLGRVLNRPAVLPLPGFVARLGLGEMADELLLASTRVEPDRLLRAGYVFRHSRLEPALRHILLD